MCLGVPGKVVRWLERTAPFESAEVEFAGVRKPIHMACVPDAALGDYVIVHAGVAICKLLPSPAGNRVAFDKMRDSITRLRASRRSVARARKPEFNPRSARFQPSHSCSGVPSFSIWPGWPAARRRPMHFRR